MKKFAPLVREFSVAAHTLAHLTPARRWGRHVTRNVRPRTAQKGNPQRVRLRVPAGADAAKVSAHRKQVVDDRDDQLLVAIRVLQFVLRGHLIRHLRLEPQSVKTALNERLQEWPAAQPGALAASGCFGLHRNILPLDSYTRGSMLTIKRTGQD